MQVIHNVWNESPAPHLEWYNEASRYNSVSFTFEAYHDMSVDHEYTVRLDNVRAGCGDAAVTAPDEDAYRHLDGIPDF